MANSLSDHMQSYLGGVRSELHACRPASQPALLKSFDGGLFFLLSAGLYCPAEWAGSQELSILYVLCMSVPS